MSPDPVSFAADLAALAWQVEAGADEAIAEAPVDRFETPAAAERAAPKAPPAAAAAPVVGGAGRRRSWRRGARTSRRSGRRWRGSRGAR